VDTGGGSGRPDRVTEEALPGQAMTAILRRGTRVRQGVRGAEVRWASWWEPALPAVASPGDCHYDPPMLPFTGTEFLESLRDGREIWI